MLKIYNLKDKQEYIKEVVTLTQKEWGKSNLTPDEFESKVIGKVRKIKKLFDDIYYCKLILLEDNELVGFIFIFTSDGEE